MPEGSIKPPRTERRIRDPARTRESILATAEAEFARHGFGGGRVDRIARKARANKRMIYHYFGHKDGLYLAVLERVYATKRAAERALEVDHRDPEAAIRLLVDFNFGYCRDHPEFQLLLNDENLHRARHVSRSRVVKQLYSPIAGYYRTVNANPSATLHTLARRSAEEYAAARTAVARFINADPREIIWTRGTTEGINLFASSWGGANLRPGDEVLVSVAEHYSNWLPWRAIAERTGATVRVFGVYDDGRLNLEEMERMLSPRTRLVAVSHVSNVLGLINPITEVARRARSVDARVLVDGAQSAPHVPIDVKASGCDFFVFSSHKMLGPMATGVAWARHEILEAMPPYQTGSNMAHEVTFDSAVFEHDGQKFQAGTPNVSGPIGLAAACAYLNGLGRAAIASHEHTLTTRALEMFRRVRGLKLVGSATADDRVPVFCFTIDGVPVPAIVKAMDDEGIAIRGGDMAALPLLERFGTKAAARVSAYLYNTVQDIDRVGTVLTKLSG